jgi:hypothetical protein
MDISRENLAVYLSTLRAILEVIDTMKQPTISKIRNKLKAEIRSIHEQIEGKSHS